MPRGRKIGPLLPSGGGYGFGYKALTTKKRLAAKAAAWDAISPAVMASVPTNVPVISFAATAPKARRSRKSLSQFNSATADQRAAMLAGLTGTANYKRPFGPKKEATKAQLAALAKGRATRAANKTGNIVAVAVAAPTTVKKSRAGRPRLSEEEKQLRKEKKETEKSIVRAAREITRAEKKAQTQQKKKTKMD